MNIKTDFHILVGNPRDASPPPTQHISLPSSLLELLESAASGKGISVCHSQDHPSSILCHYFTKVPYDY